MSIAALRHARMPLLLTFVALAGAEGASAQVTTNYVGPNGGNWNNAANWSAGIPNGNFFAVIDNNTGQNRLVNLDMFPASIHSLSVNAGDELFFLNDADLALTAGPITNNGIISMNAGGNSTELRIGASMPLTGTGVLTMSNSPNNVIRNNLGGLTTLTNSAGHTIRGSGQIGINTLVLSNAGVVEATQPTALDLDLQGTSTNTGTLQARLGGTLNIVNSAFDNTGGVIRAQDTSVVNVIGTSIVGGELATQGTGIIGASTSPPSFQNILVSGHLQQSNDEDAAYIDSIVNNGQITLNSTGNATDMRIGGTGAAFSGTGVVLLSNHINNFVRNNLGSLTTLTNQSGHTFRGAGQFGINSLTLVNDGLLDAVESATPLQIDLNGPSTNTGVLQASGGGVLHLLSTNIDNNNGVIQALNGSVVNLSDSVISNGELHTEGSGVLRTNFSPSGFVNVLVTGELEHPNDGDAFYSGTITNNGTISLEAGGNSTEMRMASNGTTFTGNGLILMGNSPNNVLRNNLGGAISFINGATHTIRGAGQIGGNSLTMTNDGLIDATQPNALIIDLTGDASANFNTGTMQASGGATLVFAATSLDNTGGLIQALNTSIVSVQGSGISGGELHTEGTGEIQASTNPPSFSNILLTGLLRHANDQDAAYFNTITNNAEIRLEAGPNSTEIRIGNNGTTFTGTGVISMSDSPNNVLRNSFGGVLSFVNSATHTIRGSGQIGINSLTLTNDGLIDANQPTALQIDLAGAHASNPNTGVMQASGGGTLTILSSPIDNTNGVIQALDGSTVSMQGADISGGELASAGTGAIRASTNVPIFSNLLVTGLLRHANDEDAVYSGTITNNGTISLEASVNSTEIRIPGTVAFAGSGQIVMSNSGNNVFRNNFGGVTTLTNGAGHTIRGGGQIGISSLNIINDGTINSDQAAGISIDMSASFVNNGLLAATAGPITLQPGGFTNNGTMRAAPGSLLHRNGDVLSLTNGGTVHLQIAGTGANQAGRVQVTSGQFQRNGTLHAEAVSGYVPVLGDRIPVFTAQSFSGIFDAVTDNFPGILGATVEYTATTGTLVIIRPSDMNCDGMVNNFDIDPFVLALTTPAAYEAAFPACEILNGDVNRDGTVNNFDIDPFVQCLTGSCP